MSAYTEKDKKHMNWDIIVIGAGASGLVAARTAAKQGKNVLVLEQMDKCGKKILATGNGKCNFTNDAMKEMAFFGNKALITHVLSNFTKEDCLSFFHEIGIYPKCKNGYYYPLSEQASSVTTALEQELKRLSVTIQCGVCVQKIRPQKHGFQLKTNQGVFRGNKVIVACGLLASPKLGSNGSLFDAIKELGHRFAPILPVLCAFYAKGLPFKKISGVRATGTVQAVVNGKKVGEDTGEIQFTDYGISGIPVFQISHFLSKALYEKKNVQVRINLLPDFSKEELLNELQFRNQLGGNLLNGLLNQKIADILLSNLKYNTNSKTACVHKKVAKADCEYSLYSTGSKQYLKKELEELCENLQNITVTIEKPRDFEFAQVCTGGILANEIEISTLESKYVNGLYFAGEVLDVDGICGGYNLHFAWGSGYLAGIYASK